MSATITWLGHSAFHIETIGGTCILVDPWIDGNPQSPVSLDDLAEIHAICVTHDHPHHLGDAVRIAEQTNAVIVASSHLTNRLAAEGLNGELLINNGAGMNLGGTARVGTVKATMVEANHLGNASAGFVLTLEDGQRIYHAGDTGLFYGMKLLAKLFSPAIACLPIGGTFTMDAKQATLAVQLMKLQRVWPMHWGSLPELAQDLDEVQLHFTKRCPRTDLILNPPGESFKLDLGTEL